MNGKLNKQMLADLKIYYKYRCQICGEYIEERYGSNLIHAHHIDYFTQSLNRSNMGFGRWRTVKINYLGVNR